MKLYYLSRICQLLVLAFVVLSGLNMLGLGFALLWMSRFSPLMTLITRVAARQWTPYFFGGVLILFVAVLVPRLFCGWICPVGGCVDLLDNHLHRPGRKHLLPGFWPIATIILLVLVIAACFGYEIAGYMDPLTITGRTASVLTADQAVAQTQNYLVAGTFDVRTIMIGMFLLILALTILGKRTWCRVLCPLGAMLGVVGAVSLKRRCVSEDCINCGRCRKSCKMGAIGQDVKRTRDQMCVFCNECVAVCPKDAVSFK